jgi:hypothetical protein
MGLPVVTTPFGARGLDVHDIVVEAGVLGFPEALAGLRQPEIRARHAAAARQVAETRLGWAAVAAARERVFTALLEAREPHRAR